MRYPARPGWAHNEAMPLPPEVLRLDAADPVATLVLCHGAWHGAWCWHDGFAQRLAARGVSTLAPSLRGHAGSAGGRHLNRMRLRHYADDLAAVVASVDGPVHVAGHSMGGGVVQTFLERTDRPRVASAALLASMPPSGVRKVTWQLARHRTGNFLAANLTWNLGRLVRTDQHVRGMFFTDRTDPGVVSGTTPRLQSESYLAFIDMLLLDRPRPRTLEERVLVVAAGDDAIFDAADAAETARRWEADLTTVEGIGHDLMLDTGWEQVADLVADWVLRA